MALSHPVRFLRSLCVVLFAVGLITACKPSGSGSDVDPRDQYVGVYEGTDRSYQSVITFGTFPIEETGVTAITVTKGGKANEVYLEVSNRPMRLTAELTGADFTIIDRTTDQITLNINGRPNVFEGAFTAKGTFGKEEASGKTVVGINAVTETTQFGTTVRRTETVVGTRK